MRYFIVKFTDKKKNERETKVTISKSTKDIGIDAKSALNIVTSNFKGVNANSIIWIKEIDEKGEQVGELITPTGETSIIPEKRN